MKKILFYITLTMSVSGCFWPFSTKHSIENVNCSQVKSSDDVRVSFEVLNPSVLKGQIKINFAPFTAGNDAEAGIQLDVVALAMIRGVSEAMADASGVVLVSGDDVDTADVLINGHIEEFKVKGRFSKRVVIKIRGDVRYKGSNEIVALVYAEKEMRGTLKNGQQLAYDVGMALGREILKERGHL